MSAVRTIGEYGARIDSSAEHFLARDPVHLYGMLQYFMGYADTSFQSGKHLVGKRLRPGLLLYIAQAYGRQEAAASAALSIELFHNFSLIHDDIEDHDELRRGRPTLWSVWGINKALNAGDAQLLLALLALKEGVGVSAEVETFLLAQYLKVIEGQHQDFLLAELPLSHEEVTEAAYLTMISNKSAELISASCMVGGLVAGTSSADIEQLRVFGFELGRAYQMHDDYQSIWGTEAETGKRALGDLVERKKSFPVIYTRDTLAREESDRFTTLFNDKTTAPETLLAVMEAVGAKEATSNRTHTHTEKARVALSRLSLDKKHIAFLSDFIDELIPQK